MRNAGLRVARRNAPSYTCLTARPLLRNERRICSTPTINSALNPLALDLHEEKAEQNANARNVAILGGGITGLSTAFHLARELPEAQIHLFEAADQLGGWIKSERVEVDGGYIIFEWGPRTIRVDMLGAGIATADMLWSLSLRETPLEVCLISKESPAARNRYIYYPDHLVRLPGPHPQIGPLASLWRNLYTGMTEPAFSGMISSLLAEPTVERRPAHLDDESVGSFLRRRFGSGVADNLASAVFHGIYAGDIYNLSARMLLAKAWYLETRDPEGNGILAELLELVFGSKALRPWKDRNLMTDLLQTCDTEQQTQQLLKLIASLLSSSVMTFQNGLADLPSTIETSLRKEEKVFIHTSSPVKSLQYIPESKRIAMTTETPDSKSGDTSIPPYDYVISTLPPSTLARLASQTSDSAFSLSVVEACNSASETSTVMVVNLFYRTPNLNPPGFGYLIPRSVPLTENPERALGVIFASETSFGQDTAPGTKFTVMFGGHWWEGWDASDFPSEAEAVEMAKSTLSRHMKITEEPLIAKSRLALNAIPQYRVGWRKAMAKIHGGVMDSFKGQLKLGGPFWQGAVGINDCIRSAKDMAMAVRNGRDSVTGLEDYGLPEKWGLVDRRKRSSMVPDEGREQ